MSQVYEHRRNDTGEVFYVGIGNDKNRPYTKQGRNRFWKRIVNKHGYSVHILHDNISWDEACQLEKQLISQYGRIDLGTGCLVNMTDGGDGTLGAIRSEEFKHKVSVAVKQRIVTSEKRQEMLSKSLETRRLNKELKKQLGYHYLVKQRKSSILL